MSWRASTVKIEKGHFLELAKQSEREFSELCKQFNISKATGYRLLKRYQEEGEQALEERSRRPHTMPLKTAYEIEQLIIKTRLLHPTWGGDKLRHYLLKQGHKVMPHEKTIDRILKRNGLITAEESEKHTAWKRFEHAYPNDLWQMDFKGHFKTGETRCHPLTLLDDHSRYSLLLKACANEQMLTVKEALIEVFRENGLPQRMTMDNGSPWGYSGKQLHTQLTAWLIHIGIKVSHSRPKHPQTQGKLERFHRTLKLELLSRYEFRDLDEAQEGFDHWQKIYNEERPHAAISLQVPKARYEKSKRRYPEQLPEIEYDSLNCYAVRKVQQGGTISLYGKEYRIGDAFLGYPVGLKTTEEEGVVDVYFSHQKVVKIDLRYPSKI